MNGIIGKVNLGFCRTEFQEIAGLFTFKPFRMHALTWEVIFSHDIHTADMICQLACAYDTVDVLII